MIIPLSSAEADLETMGGKGANLVRLVAAGFPVPPGFILTTEAYRRYLSANQLERRIAGEIDGLTAAEPAELERASQAIRSVFAQGEVPAKIAAPLRAAYLDLGGGPVAVRSSATLEDLPELSFAGQQDTFLDVAGHAALLAAVVNCWSSLWTARALGYRFRNRVAGERAALAVVVQKMVASEASGVLFTANPVSGSRRETVIDATLGLGEALVAGAIEPDHFVVDHLSGHLREKRLGAKGSQESSESGWSLDEDQIRQLVEIGKRVEAAFEGPQDIEWAIADGDLHLLQTRPITSLYPLPELSFDPLKIWFSFGSVQGLPGPMTPLGREAGRSLLAGGGRLFGLRLDPARLDLVGTAGERLWLKISDLIRNPIGQRLFGPALGYVEPSVGKIVTELAEEPAVGAGEGQVAIGTMLRIARLLLLILPRLVRTLLFPRAARTAFDSNLEGYLQEARIAPAADRFGRLSHALEFLRGRTATAFHFLLPRFLPLFAPAMASLVLLRRSAGDEPSRALEVTRGMPDNVTTEMDMALWRVASRIRDDRESANTIRQLDAEHLAEKYLDGGLPPPAQSALAEFMARYGMRGTGEIDLGRPRWREEPVPVLRTLQSYLEVEPDAAPDVRFEQGARNAQAAVERLAAGAGGPMRATLVRAAARRVRILMGARESPKFFIIRLMGRARRALLEVGEEFTAAGTIRRADDLFFLRIQELEALANQDPGPWQELISARRAHYEREGRRRQVPRVLVSDGRAFHEGLGAETDTGDVITGNPVSPGEVEGVVRVILDPHGAQLAQGEILVCPGTDPAWTPLFMTAGGLVTELGGMMTHGSVVAREYGIPAVVGVHQATQRLEDGQRIRLDGTSGQIVVVGEGEERAR